jgi:uncharacterized protein involved in outer membrane biogenesis
MKLPRSIKWILGVPLALVLLVPLLVALFGWNWLRAPVERMTLDKTGRELVIGGDIDIDLAWPRPRLQAAAVTFANPAWASERQMVAADAVEVFIDLPELFRRRIHLSEVRLVRPVVFLEQGSHGRKNWLLDRRQQDETARVRIDRLSLDQGRVGYDDAALKTHVRAELSTSTARPAGSELAFSATGLFKGMPFKTQGHGGPVLGLRDATTPYPLQAELTLGRTRVKAAGNITSLLRFATVDLQLGLRGDNLEQLYPLLGIAVPATKAYAIDGHLVHQQKWWRYDNFSGRIGSSDIAGSLQIDNAGKRPALHGDLVSKRIDLADLGELIGARNTKMGQAAVARSGGVLPDMPFNTERWHSIDAAVSLRAGSIRRSKQLPLENLVTQLHLNEAVLRLDPLDFGLAGGRLKARIELDGRKAPIQAQARIDARKIRIARLIPAFRLNQDSIGQINGTFDLSGRGNSVGSMLASANGKVGLVIAEGEISRLMMEMIGLHLWEIIALNLTGDQRIKLRCGVADFAVKDGVLQTNALIFDTTVTTLLGAGSIDLAQEKLDLTLTQKTKITSPLALRSPIHIRGSFAKPEVSVDKGRLTARALGALVLGTVNPLLALAPLIDAGPGQDSDCGQLVREAQAIGQRPTHLMNFRPARLE